MLLGQGLTTQSRQYNTQVTKPVWQQGLPQYLCQCSPGVLCVRPVCLLQVKAKVVRTYVDKMITLAKDGSLHARRQVRSSSSRVCNSVCGSNISTHEQHQHQVQQAGRGACSQVHAAVVHSRGQPCRGRVVCRIGRFRGWGLYMGVVL